MTKLQIILIGCLTVVITIFSLVFIYAFFNASDPQEIPTVMVDKPAPDFNIIELKTRQPLKLSQFKGQNIILNFWASWCLACRTEAVILEKFHRAYNNKNYLVLGIAVNDNYLDALNFANEYNKTYITALDEDNSILLNYGITGVPETFIINQQGIIVHKFIGEISYNDLTSYFGFIE